MTTNNMTTNNTNRHILARPVAGPLAGRLLVVPDDDVTIIGFAHKLHLYVHGSWVATVPLDGGIYAWSRRFGVVKVKSRTLKALADQLGVEFVTPNQGILVALKACLVDELRERQCGVLRSHVAVQPPVIDWVRCSRDGARTLRSLL